MSFSPVDYVNSPFNALLSDANFFIFSQNGAEILQLFGVFDAITEENYQNSLGKSEYPIETGATLTDHAFIKPQQLTLTCSISSILISTETTLLTPFRDREGWERIILAQNERTLFTVNTLLATYNNMLLVNVTTQKNDQIAVANLIATLEFSQQLIAETETTNLPENQISGAAQTKPSTTNRGDVQSEDAEAQGEGWLTKFIIG